LLTPSTSETPFSRVAQGPSPLLRSPPTPRMAYPATGSNSVENCSGSDFGSDVRLWQGIDLVCKYVGYGRFSRLTSPSPQGSSGPSLRCFDTSTAWLAAASGAGLRSSVGPGSWPCLTAGWARGTGCGRSKPK
jgi:hypothetical protein